MQHFFETDLPLPVARKLNLQKLAPPERMTGSIATMAARIDALALCRLSDAEREGLEVPVVDDWYRLNRSGKLHRMEYLLRDSAEDRPAATSVCKEDFEAVGHASHAAYSLDYLVKLLRRYRHDGMLTMDVLLSRGLRRIFEIQECKHCTAPPAGVSEPAALKAYAGPPRDMDALARAVQHEVLRQGVTEVAGLLHEFGIPNLSVDSWEKEEAKEKKEAFLERLRKAAEPRAAELAQACLDQLYPRMPDLAEQSGIHPESLALLLRWRAALDPLEGLAAQLAQDLEDMDRVIWQRGRSLIRTVFTDYASTIAKRADQENDRRLLWDLTFTVEQMRKDPPPRLVGQWIRSKHQLLEERWRTRLGFPKPARA